MRGFECGEELPNRLGFPVLGGFKALADPFPSISCRGARGEFSEPRESSKRFLCFSTPLPH